MTVDPGADAWLEESRTLTALRAAFPAYEVFTYRPYGSDRLRYVAQRRPGAACEPAVVVTADPAELCAELTAGGAP